MATATDEFNDKEITPDGLTVLKCVREAKHEAETAKRRRQNLNRINWQSYMGQQDWSHKQPGQSREFLPKVPVAVEQFSAFIKKALVSYGNWFSVDAPPHSPLNENEIRELLKCFLTNLADGFRESTSFALQISDGCKASLLEAVMTFKIHGYKVPQQSYRVERGFKFVEGKGFKETAKLKQKEHNPWRLAIDLISADDYFPDPTGRKLYEIHRVERDFHDVMELADQGLYDPDVVDQIMSDFDERLKEYQDAATRNQQGVTPPSFRRTVIIDEYWGDLVDENGRLKEKNIVCAMANEKYLIREPEPNPNWHGDSPFVSIPLVRVPHTVWHKALFDHASPLNMALNEIFNLVLDGGLASVWGIKQMRMGGLEDARQVSGGLSPGMTLAVKDEFPAGEKVVEVVATGEVPADALNTFNLANQEFQSAALTNDLKLGQLPEKQVRATEIVEIQQSQAVTLDGITVDMETGIVKILEKAWLCMLQNASDLDAQEIIAAVGPKAALLLSRMSPAERYARFGQGYGIKVFGLSATMARVKEFQKRMALQQVIQTSPPLLESYLRRYDPDQDLDAIMKSLNVNPEDIGLKPAAMADLPNRVNRMAQLSQMFGMQKAGSNGGANGMMATNSGGNPGSPQAQAPAEINQAANPLSGMAGA